MDKVAQILNGNVEIPETINIEGLNKLGVSLHKLLTVFKAVTQEHNAYLIRTGTPDSLKEIENYSIQLEQSHKFCDDFISKSNNAQSTRTEAVSSGESSLSSSKTSSVTGCKGKERICSSKAALKKEQAQIVREQMIAEAAPIRKKEELAADLDLLNQDKELAVYATETHALETASNPPDSQGLYSLPIGDPLERVDRFISAQKQDQNKDNNEIIENKLYFL